MNSTMEIKEKIANLYKSIKDNELEIKELKGRKTIPGSFKEQIEYRKTHREEINAIDMKIETLSDENKINTLKVNILNNNYKIALFYELMPRALEVFNKWKNKPYGEKTKEKIKEEILEKTGKVVYIQDNSFRCIGINGDYGNNLECGTKYIDGSKKPILVDNKIQELNMDDLEVYYINKDYVENLDKEVEIILELHNKALTLKKELENVCNEFNEHAVDGISYLSITANNFYSL